MDSNVLGYQSHLPVLYYCNFAILLVVTKDLPISPRFSPSDFLERCKFSTLITPQPVAGFYLLAFSRLPLRKLELKSDLTEIELTISALTI